MPNSEGIYMTYIRARIPKLGYAKEFYVGMLMTDRHWDNVVFARFLIFNITGHWTSTSTRIRCRKFLLNDKLFSFHNICITRSAYEKPWNCTMGYTARHKRHLRVGCWKSLGITAIEYMDKTFTAYCYVPWVETVDCPVQVVYSFIGKIFTTKLAGRGWFCGKFSETVGNPVNKIHYWNFSGKCLRPKKVFKKCRCFIYLFV